VEEYGPLLPMATSKLELADTTRVPAWPAMATLRSGAISSVCTPRHATPRNNMLGMLG